MSLSIVFPTQHGIVMSADRRIMTTTQRDGYKESFLLTDNEQKLFVLPGGYGLSYTGNSSIDGNPLSSIVNTFLSSGLIFPSNPKDLIVKIASHLNELNSKCDNSILMLAGYYKNVAFSLSINTKDLELQEFSCGNFLPSFSGETDMLNSLLNNPEKYNYDYHKYTLHDAISFLSLLNKTVASFQFFQQRSQTVSVECDILAILPDSTKWINRSLLAMPNSPPSTLAPYAVQPIF